MKKIRKKNRVIIVQFDGLYMFMVKKIVGASFPRELLCYNETIVHNNIECIHSYPKITLDCCSYIISKIIITLFAIQLYELISNLVLLCHNIFNILQILNVKHKQATTHKMLVIVDDNGWWLLLTSIVEKSISRWKSSYSLKYVSVHWKLVLLYQL